MEAEIRENMRGGEGAVRIRHYVPGSAFRANVRLCAQLVLPPGSSIGLHRHEGEDEVYIVVRGRGQLDEGQGHVRVEPGDAILTGDGESHSILNDCDEPLELTAMIVRYPAPETKAKPA